MGRCIMGYVFISYSSKNQPSVDAMRALLRKYHIDHWIAPDDIPAGSKYAKVIGQAIKNCTCMLLLLTEDAQNSPWVPKEVERAINYKKPILPVQLEDLQLNEEFEMYISTDHLVRVYDIDESSAEIQKVLSSVIAMTGQTSDSTVSQKAADSKPDTPPKRVAVAENPRRKQKAAVSTEQRSTVALPDREEVKDTAKRLQEFLSVFRISAVVTAAISGPQVTRYELKLDKSVRLHKLTSLADEIAQMLNVPSVRIVAVPGQSAVVGIEVPNRIPNRVTLSEVLTSSAFTQSESKSSFAVGKAIDGTCVVADLAKLPHLLVAGAVNSGMVVFINAMLVSLLTKASAEDVQLILVDTKVVELSIYNGLPHLLGPVVTEPKEAVTALQWAAQEMMDRFQKMSWLGVRDLVHYNSMIEEKGGRKLPRIVVIVNELADLMKYSAVKTEDALCRIAQLGRAAGIHLILATQRPSQDVITGLIKANIPSRISFAVASAAESRIILDTLGAEKLLGWGDMLFSPIGSRSPMRIQGCYVSGGEVRDTVACLKETDGKPVQEEQEVDDMFPMAVEVVLETGVAAIAMIQRRLKLGYARSARIMDQMEAQGIVGPYQGTKPREILITKEQWTNRKNLQ